MGSLARRGLPGSLFLRREAATRRRFMVVLARPDMGSITA